MDVLVYAEQLRSLSSRVRSNVRSVVYANATDYVSEMREMSPLDSGMFKSSWSLSRAGVNRSVYHSLIIRNNTPYGIYLDEGALKGGPPWFFPKKRAGDGATSATGKLIVKNGRVWAGGLSPYGHVIGGISDTVLNDRRMLKLAGDVADGIIAAI